MTRHHQLTFEFLYLWIRTTIKRVIISLLLKISQIIRGNGIPSDVTLKRIKIPSRDKGRKISAFKYVPDSAKGPGPHHVHINWHGSGFILSPMFGTDRELCARIAHETGAIVLDCDYRKAPEFPYPAAIEDAQDAVIYVLAHGNEYDITRISVGGSSAGGCLALGVCAAFGRDRINAVTCLYPATSMDRTIIPAPPRTEHRTGVVFKEYDMTFFRRCYLLPGDDLHGQIVSPLFAPANAFPDLIFTACGDADTLWGDSKLFFDKIQAEGSPAQKENFEFFLVEQEAHGYDQMAESPEELADKEETFAAIVDHVKRGFKP